MEGEVVTSASSEKRTVKESVNNAVADTSKEVTLTPKMQQWFTQLRKTISSSDGLPEDKKEDLLRACVRKVRRVISRPPSEKKPRSEKQIAATQRMLAARKEKLRKK